MKNETVVALRGAGVLFNVSSERVDSLKEYVVRLARGNLRFRPFWALRHIDLTIRRGEVVGFAGVNGAGKSTLLKLVAGVLHPTEGTVRTRGKIAPLIELGAGFDGDLTARENVFLNGAILGYARGDMARRYEEIISFAGLEAFEELPVKNFSSGMTARLGFAIATAHTPDILIVDEVLSVGDFRFREKCERRIRAMIESGVTVLVVSHSAEALCSLCSRVVWLREGRICMDGDARTVMDAYLSA